MATGMSGCRVSLAMHLTRRYVSTFALRPLLARCGPPVSVTTRPSTSTAAPYDGFEQPPVLDAGVLRKGVGRRRGVWASPRKPAPASILGSASSPDYFALLLMEPRFNQDTTALRRRYMSAMALTHPDHHAREGYEKLHEAAERAALLTQAYTTLRLPHLRAKHLLELLGWPLSEEGGGNMLASAFLMEEMQLRTELEAGPSTETLRRLSRTNEQRMQEVCQRLAAAFEKAEMDKAQQLTAELQHLHRMQTEIQRRSPLL